jgi:hypothetical protein
MGRTQPPSVCGLLWADGSGTVVVAARARGVRAFGGTAWRAAQLLVPARGAGERAREGGTVKCHGWRRQHAVTALPAAALWTRAARPRAPSAARPSSPWPAYLHLARPCAAPSRWTATARHTAHRDWHIFARALGLSGTFTARRIGCGEVTLYSIVCARSCDGSVRSEGLARHEKPARQLPVQLLRARICAPSAA